MENPIKMDDLEVPLFLETSKSWGELEKIEKEKEELREEMAKFREERDSENRHQMRQLKQKEAEIKVGREIRGVWEMGNGG